MKIVKNYLGKKNFLIEYSMSVVLAAGLLFFVTSETKNRDILLLEFFFLNVIKKNT